MNGEGDRGLVEVKAVVAGLVVLTRMTRVRRENEVQW